MMRNPLFALATLALALPLAGQETRFTKEMASGARLEVSNINGSVTVSRASGRTAEVIVTKRVKRGDGSLVKAILEEERGVVRVCTIYLNREPNRTTCKGDNNNGSGRNDKRGDDSDRLEVEMTYEVRVPSGVLLEADNVNGDVTVTGLDATANVETVNGNVRFEGSTAATLSTVNGNIRADLGRGSWAGDMHVETVNGSVDLGFPSSLDADVSGTTVNGRLDPGNFPMTIQGKWGPKMFTGKIGRGGSRLSIETVNGNITLRERR